MPNTISTFATNAKARFQKISKPIVNKTKQGYHFVKTKIGNVDRKVGRLLRQHLPKKLANFTLNLIRALPTAVTLLIVPQPLTVVTGAVGIAVSLIKPDFIQSIAGASLYNGLGIATGIYAIAHAVRIFTQKQFFAHLALTGIHLTLCALALTHAQYIEKKVQKAASQ